METEISNVGMSAKETRLKTKSLVKKSYYVKKPPRPKKAQCQFRIELALVQRWEEKNQGEAFSDWVRGVVISKIKSGDF